MTAEVTACIVWHARQAGYDSAARKRQVDNHSHPSAPNRGHLLRPKSLPVSLRGSPRAPSQRSRPQKASSLRAVDWFATLPVLLLLPAILAVSSLASASGPSLQAAGSAHPGQTFPLTGAGHRSGARVQLLWDGHATAMPVANVDSAGGFTVAITIPMTAQVGRHQVSTTYQVERSTRGNAKVEAAATVDVLSMTAATPTPVALASSPAKTNAPLQPKGPPSPTAVAATATPTEAAAATSTPLPLTESTPSPAPVQTPVATLPPVTPAPTPAPATPAPIPTSAPTTTSCSTVVPLGASVTAAVQDAVAGQTICLRGGTYAENINVDPPNGTAAARITLTSYPGERASIAGLVRFSGLNYWTIRSIGFTWNGGAYDQHMVKITGGTGWLIDRVEMWGARSFANLLVTGSPHGWSIRNSVLRDTYGGESNSTRSHNLYVNAPNGTNGLIQGNILQNAPMGYNAKLSGSGYGTDGTDNVRFVGNTLVNANRANLLLGNDATNNVVEGNVFSNSSDGWAVRLWDLRGSGNIIRNNVYANATLCNDYESSVPCAQVVGTGNIQQP